MSQNNEILWEIKFTRLCFWFWWTDEEKESSQRAFISVCENQDWKASCEDTSPEAEGLQERTVGADFLNVPSWSRRGTWEPGGRMLRTLRSSMMTPIFLILITNKIYTMTIAINQWMSLFSTICNPCYSGTFDNKIIFWGENILLEIFWYWYTTWTLYGYMGMC